MERISTHQFMIIGASVLMGGTFLLIASAAAEIGGRDGWMAVLPSFVLTIPYSIMVLSLSSQYPKQNLLQISETVFGKWIGKFIGLIYTLISCYYGGLALALLGLIYEQSIMPLVPRWIFYIGGLLLVFYLTNSGIEVFARFCEVVFPIIVITIILNIIFTIPRIEPEELLPILGEGIKPLFPTFINISSLSMVYILFLSGILTYLPTDKQDFDQMKAGIWRFVFLVGILNTFVVLIQILVFGPSETIRQSFGILQLGKMVEISRTISGVESLFLGVWLGTLVIKCSAYFFMTNWGLESTFKLKGLKWRFMASIIFLGIALIFIQGASLRQELFFMERYIIFPFAFVWILILWGISRWKLYIKKV